MVNNRVGVGNKEGVGVDLTASTDGCAVGDTGSAGRMIGEEAGFWLQDTNPTNKKTASMLLKCIRL